MFSSLIRVTLIAGAAASPLIQPRQSTIPVGTAIFSCTVPNTVALTFDDGPFTYTSSVLDQLDAAGMKGTFFMNGNNWGNIYDYTTVVQRAVEGGHQVASHTWAHPDLATLDAAAVTSQMTDLETAFLSIIGKFPTYMRPPYFSYTDETLETLGGLGYHVIHADIDTQDWQFNTLGNTTSVGIFEAGLDAGGGLTLAHDVHENTAVTLVPAMIAAVQSRGLSAVTVGECLGDAAENCQWGWCGTTSDYCATGCQSAFGICS
ncbi:uncharacterized protein BCR38DRAFT_468653 [Pseudomassariella vexata]|uniref:NodB homology domain-containing protein n=1 Tax=Pseudomassariella vexata TaxID=1141098 RepID=A0A1Y2DGI3_9PEZI|nr:uncharacterized protein BCR38DRAFT_468653 [Pseudomassariella vexata]ORY58382.1 hypothetical protein BCR38DRAFT_468653 [Pseudomassariella vexata]